MSVSFSRRRIGGASPLAPGAAGPAPILPQPGEDLTSDKLVTALDDVSANRVYESRRLQVQAFVDRTSDANTS